MRDLVCFASAASLAAVLATGCLGDDRVPTGDPPLLTDLAVTPGAMWPAFEPDQPDYGVVCNEGTTQLTITAVAEAGASVEVEGGDAEGRVTASEGQVITVRVDADGRPSGRYYVRCLPHDFPPLTVRRSAPGNTPGWYMFTTFTAFPLSPPYYVIIIDGRGAVVWYKQTAGWALDVRRLAGGTLLWHDASVPITEEHRLDGSLVRTWETSGALTDAHDAVPLANGNLMMGSAPMRAGVDVSVLAPAFTGVTNVLDAWLQEIRPDGSVAWEWHSEDHIGVIELTAHLDGVNLQADPLDLVHWNSVELDPDGNVLMSARHTDSVYKIRRNPGQPDDGAILWKLGGNAPVEPGAVDLTFVDDPYDGLARQHDARLLANGHLTLYDNRSARAGDFARGVEYVIDEQAGTATLVWEQRTDGGPSCCMGSVRRDADGANLIAWGGADPMFTEYAADGTPVFEVEAPVWSYRVVKVAATDFDRTALRDAGGGAVIPSGSGRVRPPLTPAWAAAELGR